MAKKNQDDTLQEIKDNIKKSYQYFKKNVETYEKVMKFVFETAITAEDDTKLDILNKPPLEFNVLESVLSRLRGEFAKQEPDIIGRAADGVRVEDLTPEFLAQLDCIQAHLKELFFDAANDGLEYNLYSDLLGGGYSVASVFTDYINEMSFEQNIKIERVFDPTLCGFDPLARESHKGDGDYCFMCLPKTKEQFEAEFGKGLADEMNFTRGTSVGDFNWSYITQQEEIILVADYYCKVKKREKIVKLSNGHVVLEKHYDDFMELWNKQGFIEQAPIVIQKRETIIETIERYLVCENKILSKQKTNFKYLPLVFIDGNSVVLKEAVGNASMQVTRPFVMHALGAQQLINFAGQTVAAEIENMVMHKFIVPIEGIPEGYEGAYKNVQQASTLAYNSFYKDDPEKPLAPPQVVQRTPTPPLVENTFNGTNRIIQTILGTYDSTLATNDKQISGVAIQQGALQSNAAAIPYLKGYIKGINRIAQIVVDLIPKYYVTPRSLPIKGKDGKRTYQVINQPDDPNSIDLKYNPNNFQIKVEAGVSSGIQKQVAIEQIIRMTQASPTFAEFINSMGLETILDNMDIRGIEHLKAQALVFMKQQAERQQQASQQPSPEQMQMETLREIEMAKVEQLADKTEGDLAIQAAKVANEKQALDIKFMEVMAKVEQGNTKLAIDQEKVDAENSRSAVETAISFTKQLHENRRGAE